MIVHCSAEIVTYLWLGLAEKLVQRDKPCVITVHIEAISVIIGSIKGKHFRLKITHGKSLWRNGDCERCQRVYETFILSFEICSMKPIKQNKTAAIYIREKLDKWFGARKGIFQPFQ